MVRNSNPFERRDSRRKSSGGGSWLLVILGVAVVVILVVALFVPENDPGQAASVASVASDSVAAAVPRSVSEQPQAFAASAVDGARSVQFLRRDGGAGAASAAQPPPQAVPSSPNSSSAPNNGVPNRLVPAAVNQFNRMMSSLASMSGFPPQYNAAPGAQPLSTHSASFDSPVLRGKPSQCTNLPYGETHEDQRDFNTVIKYASFATNFLEWDRSLRNLFVTGFVKGKHFSIQSTMAPCLSKTPTVKCFEEEGRLEIVCVPEGSSATTKGVDGSQNSPFVRAVDNMLVEQYRKNAAVTQKIDVVYVGDTDITPLAPTFYALRYTDQNSIFMVKNFWGNGGHSQVLLRFFDIIDGAAYPTETHSFGNVVVLRPKPDIPPVAKQFAYSLALGVPANATLLLQPPSPAAAGSESAAAMSVSGGTPPKSSVGSITEETVKQRPPPRRQPPTEDVPIQPHGRSAGDGESVPPPSPTIHKRETKPHSVASENGDSVASDKQEEDYEASVESKVEDQKSAAS